MTQPNTVLDRNRSSTTSRQVGSGRGGSRVRLLRFTKTRSVWGNQYMSTWWFSSTSWSNPSTALAQGSGPSTASSVNAGST